MALIIDGHNLIGALPDLDLRDPNDEQELVNRLRAYRARRGSQDLIVFFDSGDFPASADGLSSAGVRVNFALPGQSADDAIVDFVRRQAQPGQYAVVTNDQELGNRIRLAGASLASASDFAGRLVRKRKPGVPSPEPSLNPHDPAFADIYDRFLQSEKLRARAKQDAQAAPEKWMKQLYDGEPEEALQAVDWLAVTGGGAACEALRDALTHGDARVRAAAALALGSLGFGESVPDISRLLAADRASMVRQAAAQSLGQLGGRPAENALQTAAAGDSKGRVRKAATRALAEIRARRG